MCLIKIGVAKRSDMHCLVYSTLRRPHLLRGYASLWNGVQV
jgi:hypothetical protein